MTILTSRQFFLRFVKSAITGESALYGSETYGADPFSYGQEATETVFPSTEYSLLPYPGYHPQEPAWTYRVGDQNEFACAIVDSNDPSSPIDVSPVDTAHVVLTEERFDQQLPWYRTFNLIPEEATNQLRQSWLQGDLRRQGRYRVTVRVLFASGRYLTVEANDNVMLNVNGSTDSEIPEGQDQGRWM